MDLLKLEDEKLVQKVVDDFKKSDDSSYRQNYLAQSKENYRLYKSKLKEKREGANLFIPYTWATVEQLKARIIQALFTRTPYVGYAGVGKDDVDGAKVMEDLVYYQMKDKINLPYKFSFAAGSILIYGMAIGLYQWRLEEKKIKLKKDIIQNEMKVGEELYENVITSYDDPDIEFIPIDDFHWDPEGWDKKTCAFYATRADRDMEYLKKKEEEGIYKLPEQIENDAGEIVSNFRDDVNEISSTSEDRKKKHEIITYYTDDAKIVILNRKHVILKEENELHCKEKPFVKIVAFPQEKEFPGMSMVQILQSLQEELNTTRNQRIDNVSLILNKVFGYNQNADIDPNDIKSKAGHAIPMNHKNDVWEFDVTDVTSSAYQEEQIIKQDIQFVSSVSEYTRGATPQRKETATTVNTIQEAANVVFNYITMIIEITGLIPLADAIKKMNQQYISENRVIRLFDVATGQWNYPEITPESIQGNYDVVSTSPRLESQQTKEAKRQQMLEMFSMFMKEQSTRQFVNVPEFMRKIMETYDIKDYEKLIVNLMPTPDPNIPTQQNIDLLQEMSEENGY